MTETLKGSVQDRPRRVYQTVAGDKPPRYLLFDRYYPLRGGILHRFQPDDVKTGRVLGSIPDDIVGAGHLETGGEGGDFSS